LRELLGFYENELTNNLLPYWLTHCVDTMNGGFVNCFDNSGEVLVSTDKYIWSQGRFTWLWVKLADLQSETFTAAQRKRFLELSKHGCDFLRRHALIAENDLRCVYLTDAQGNHKKIDGYDGFDVSIYADCFVINAFAQYAQVQNDREAWTFSKRLYDSVRERLGSGQYNTLPYPLPAAYRAHGIPMILSNVTKEMLAAADVLEPSFSGWLMDNLAYYVNDTLAHFVDDAYLLRETIYTDNTFIPNILGQHVNPGHTIEDMWFMMDAAERLQKPELLEQITRITKKALETGWDKEYGGLYHFATLDGGMLQSVGDEIESEPTLQHAIRNSSGKIWWVHSEALYTTLRLYCKTGDESLLAWYDRIADYVFEKFPNPNREVREWLQTLDRQGNPREKSVGLPVKDPYHIMRNIALIIELLYSELQR